MSDRFESALWKIDQARKHASDLEVEIATFMASDPYEIEIIGTPFAGQGFYRVNRMTPLPATVSLIAGDAAHNIRSALDHFAWAAVSSRGRGVHTCFPIWNSAGTRTPVKWRNQVTRQMNGASVELIEAVRGLEPWETGRDSLLWAVHELDRLDKHRLLLSVAVVPTGVHLDGDSYELTVAKKLSGADPSKPLALAPSGWTPLEEGAELFSHPDGIDLGATRTTLSFDVMLGEPEMLRDKSAIAQLRILAGQAEKVILDLAPLAKRRVRS